ncbi:MAG: glycerophosphodiester phosphodiesterase [Bacteroidales bacterium]|nr:glycerophosphodiester phosphodiesterase [Bacteroidales bacterium]
MKLNGIFPILACAALLFGCSAPKQTATTTTQQSPSATTRANTGFPALGQDGKIAIVAHRGFWNCEAGGMSENSIASLKAAQDAGVWGSECDVHITTDNVVLVNHNNDINGKVIEKHKYADFASDLLPNGERRPTLDEYLAQAAKCPTTKLIIELKPHNAEAREDALVAKTIEILKAQGMYDPKKVLFISFSRHICDLIAEQHPQFVNQFLSANVVKNENPKYYANRGINGVDYHFRMFSVNPGWIEEAHALGMSVNAWTVDKESDIKEMINLGVDAITSNYPLLVRELLGDKEYTNKK